MISLTHVNIKNSTNESTYKTENRPTDTENQLLVTKGKKEGAIN